MFQGLKPRNKKWVKPRSFQECHIYFRGPLLVCPFVNEEVDFVSQEALSTTFGFLLYLKCGQPQQS